MALIQCPDCGKQISDLAFSCLGCGRPMSATAQATGNPQRVVTEKTGKNYKAQQVISAMLAGLFVILFFSTEDSYFLYALMACLVWHITILALIWWEHG